jgi:hypothetical protein
MARQSGVTRVTDGAKSYPPTTFRKNYLARYRADLLFVIHLIAVADLLFLIELIVKVITILG